MRIKSLKNNIIIYLLLFSIVPLFIASTFILYNAYNSEKKNIFYKHNQFLTQALDETDTLLNDIEDIGVYLKDRYPIKKHGMVSGLLRVGKNINTVMILNNDGILVDFSTSTKKNNIFIGYDYSNTKYFKAIKNGAKRHWTDVYLSLENHIPSISYSVRIDKDTIAVLIVNLKVLDNFSKRFKSGDGSTMIQIIDKNGIYISNLQKPETVSQRQNIHDTDLFTLYDIGDDSYKQIQFLDEDKKENIAIFGISKKLNWLIVIQENYNFVFKTYYSNLRFIILFAFVLISLSIYFSFKFSKSILRPLDEMSEKMDDVSTGKTVEEIKYNQFTELRLLSTNFLLMQSKLKDREEQNRLKDKQLHESSKMAQMGEMIGNIAHQWRQPLSFISTAASGMKVQKEYSILTDEKFYNYCDQIVEHTHFLSETIDTFRNFIRDNKEIREIILQNEIDNTLKVISSSLSNNYIRLLNKINYDTEIKMLMSMGELSQVIINIINNAKDILLEKKIESPYIEIELYTIDKKVIIAISDNGGGIPSEIIEKVFDPYFTTKHKSQGTGLGLHMSYKIITESLKGKIYVQNTKEGAKFFIELPLEN